MHLIPRPARLTTTPGTWQLTENTGLIADPAAGGAAELLRELVGRPAGSKLAPAAEPGPDTIRLRVDPALADEEYRLSVSTEGVVITGGRRGLPLAVQTLRQLLPAEIFATGPAGGAAWTVPYVEIEDAPRFGWRGVMLDVARHWYPVAFLHRMVDLAALHKLNVVHLHLTDDQGWRMEIDRYPRLTEVGAWRAESMLGHYSEGRYDGVPHGGFYTKSELRDLVAHARTRGITIVPEIDMPGHMRAAIAAYPELGDDPERALPVATAWGVHEQVLKMSEETIAFCRHVLEEVLEVFPSEWIHIGGDECPKREWEESAWTQARLRELGLSDAHALQSWFIGRMADFLAERGRRLIGWDEILQGGLAPGATVMSWQGEQGGIDAARAGHDAVMCPHTHTYFDFYQAEPDGEPLAIGGLTTLEHVYAYRPVPAGLEAEAAGHVLGTQGQLWSEYLPTSAHVEYMAFPRLCALAEVAWGTAGEYAGFTERLLAHRRRLDHLGVAYRR
ncbi:MULTISPECIES: beta-N-acetylhexosaminidase [Streptosporangium]|uniref:beta-N-acetylhexosaminidase n=1 Tax=Streptosporangium brasiliense TaxID=47480 RepID=A0ABT9RHW3_9ACTN|nr:beta-N-acetylhexosaminidase [Streptosporangium brasiliense]MDP9867935.1 hexosaminidase [Streptosporangium brasiliense]